MVYLIKTERSGNVMRNEKYDSQKKQSAFYLFNFFIGFISFSHGISSWIVSRISYTRFTSELNWIFIFFIAAGGLFVNYLLLKDVKTKEKYMCKGLIAFIAGAFIVSVFFIVRVG
jgi:hypothetical protein